MTNATRSPEAGDIELQIAMVAGMQPAVLAVVERGYVRLCAVRHCLLQTPTAIGAAG